MGQGGERRVYFLISESDPAYIKVGFSVDPHTRCRVISKYCPWPARLLTIVEGGHDLERRFHAHFKRCQTHGEWFLPDDAMRADVESICAGLFDLDSLPAPEVITRTYRNEFSGAAGREKVMAARIHGVNESHPPHTPKPHSPKRRADARQGVE